MTKGILLVNLGTPKSPAPKDVREYLLEFLTDERVVDLPWLKRQILVRGIIVPRRYKESASTYDKVWTAQGSPLMVWGEKLRDLVARELGDGYKVALAMRYQDPAIPSVLETLQGCSEIIICPLFPQYAGATTGSVQQKVMETIKDWQVIPNLRFISNFPDFPPFINAWEAIARNYTLENYDHILFSFHGLPEGQLRKADRTGKCLQDKSCCDRVHAGNEYCYRSNCFRTAKALVQRLNLGEGQYTVCFQSRLGKVPWLRPYTSDVIEELGKKGAERVLVFSPSFVCDCIETTHELGIEGAEAFQTAGGGLLQVVEGLNDHPQWVQALCHLLRHPTLPSQGPLGPKEWARGESVLESN